MPERRPLLLDAAIEVVGRRGLRALTHRAVDAEAGLPLGSTSNMFRTRARLVSGVLERLLEQETAAWGTTAPLAPEATDAVDRVTAMLAARVELLSGELRAVTITRFALYHEAALDQALAGLIARSRARVEEGVGQWLAELGLPLDRDRISALLSTVNGLLVERVSTAGADAVDPADSIRLVLSGLAHAGPPGREPDEPGGAR